MIFQFLVTLKSFLRKNTVGTMLMQITSSAYAAKVEIQDAEITGFPTLDYVFLNSASFPCTGVVIRYYEL